MSKLLNNTAAFLKKPGGIKAAFMSVTGVAMFVAALPTMAPLAAAGVAVAAAAGSHIIGDVLETSLREGRKFGLKP